MEYKDYYQTLGVSRDADAKQIKRAFRKLARELHPDVNPGDKAAETRFKEVAEAYEVLGDPAKREKYDQFGRQWQQYERAGQAGGFDWSQWQRQGRPDGQYTYTTAQDLEELFGQGAGGFGGAGGFSDFFEALFGGRAPGATGTRPRGGRGGPSAARGRPAGGAAGRDLEHPVQVTLAEAYGGSTRLLNKDGRRLEVTIPAGVRTGSKVRVAGEGAPGHEKAGDLYLVIEVLDDPRFQRDGDDLSTDVEVPLVTAMLGGEARVPTPTGELVLAIPAETQNARRFRLRGKGMPKLRHPEQRGDLYATVRVKLPTGLSVEEKALFERLQELRA